MSNYRTVPSILSIPWVLEPGDAELVNDVRTGERDASGQWMKQDVKLNIKPATFSAAQTAMAELYDSEPEMLFSARR